MFLIGAHQSAMLRKEIVQKCDTQCTEGDCDVILNKYWWYLVVLRNSLYFCITLFMIYQRKQIISSFDSITAHIYILLCLNLWRHTLLWRSNKYSRGAGNSDLWFRMMINFFKQWLKIQENPQYDENIPHKTQKCKSI